VDGDIERLLDGAERLLDGADPDPFFLKNKVIVKLSRDECNSHSGHDVSIVRDAFGYAHHARCSCGTEPVGTLGVEPKGRGVTICGSGPEPMADLATTPSAPSCPVCLVVGFDCGHSE